MFCPKCGAEYAEGVTTCKQCSVALVAAAPKSAGSEGDDVDLVVILRTNDESQLSVVKTLLEAEGIPCLLRERGAQGIVDFGRVGAANIAMGMIELLVRADQAEAARELVAAQDLAFVEPGDAEWTPPEEK